jgi:hypothetical protein
MSIREWLTRDLTRRQPARPEVVSSAPPVARRLRPAFAAAWRTGVIPVRFPLTRWTLLVFGLVVALRYDPPTVSVADAVASTVRAAPIFMVLLAADALTHLVALRRPRRGRKLAAPTAGTLGQLPWLWRQRFRRLALATAVAALVGAAGQGLSGHPGGALRWLAERLAAGAVVPWLLVAAALVAAAVPWWARRQLQVTVPVGAGSPPPVPGGLVSVETGWVGEHDARQALSNALAPLVTLDPGDDGSRLPGALVLVGPPGSGRSTLTARALDQAGVASVSIGLAGRSRWRAHMSAWQARATSRALAARCGAVALVVDIGDTSASAASDAARDLVRWATERRPERRLSRWGPPLRGLVVVIAAQREPWMIWPLVAHHAQLGCNGPDFALEVLESAGVPPHLITSVLEQARRSHGPNPPAAALLAAARSTAAPAAVGLHGTDEHPSRHASEHATVIGAPVTDQDRRAAVARAGSLLVAAQLGTEGPLETGHPTALGSRNRADEMAVIALAAAAAEDRLTGDVSRPGREARADARALCQARCDAYGGDAASLLDHLETQAVSRVAGLDLAALCAVSHAQALFGPLTVGDAVSVARGAQARRGDGRWYLDPHFAAEVEAWCRLGAPIPLPARGRAG